MDSQIKDHVREFQRKERRLKVSLREARGLLRKKDEKPLAMANGREENAALEPENNALKGQIRELKAVLEKMLSS